jgi:hypothetical protein
VYIVGDAFDDNGVIPATTASRAATFNKTAYASSLAYDIYTASVGPPAAFISVLNVGATIGGRNVTDWTGFQAQTMLPSCAS